MALQDGNFNGVDEASKIFSPDLGNLPKNGYLCLSSFEMRWKCLSFDPSFGGCTTIPSFMIRNLGPSPPLPLKLQEPAAAVDFMNRVTSWPSADNILSCRK